MKYNNISICHKDEEIIISSDGFVFESSQCRYIAPVPLNQVGISLVEINGHSIAYLINLFNNDEYQTLNTNLVFQHENELISVPCDSWKQVTTKSQITVPQIFTEKFS